MVQLDEPLREARLVNCCVLANRKSDDKVVSTSENTSAHRPLLSASRKFVSLVQCQSDLCNTYCHTLLLLTWIKRSNQYKQSEPRRPPPPLRGAS